MKKKRFVPVLAVLALVVVIVIIMLLGKLIDKYTPTKETEDLTEYYGMTNAEDMAVIKDDAVMSYLGRYIDGEAYIDYNSVHDELNSRFYWDANENVLLYTTSTDVITVNAGENQYYVSKEATPVDYTIVRVDGGTMYLALDFVKQYTAIDFVCYEDPARVVVTSVYGSVDETTVKKDTELRVKGGIKSPILKEAPKGEVLTVLEADETWTKVASVDGVIGYVKSKTLGDTQTRELTSDFVKEEFTHILKDGAVNMIWHQVTNQSANGNISSVLASTKGVNVVSPTWFYLNDNSGNLACLASNDYVNYCHQNGVQVWALFSNLENAETSAQEVLTHTSTRQNLVNQIISYAIQYNLDGVNIDFEALSSDVGDGYIQFIRELSLKCANNGVILSVDNYAPTASSAFYNRSEQAVFADYIVIMGYDEHYNGSDEGSVASLPFVQDAVTNTMAENVPANQIILGMPFYTRVWAETPKEGEASELEQASDDYIPYDLSSWTVGMGEQANLIASNGATTNWLEVEGQNYAEYINGGVTYKIWVEDATSLEKKLEVMKNNSLAGASFWKAGLEDSAVWDTIIKYLN